MKATFVLLLSVGFSMFILGQDSIPHQQGKTLEIKGHWFSFQTQDFLSTINVDPSMLSQQRGGQLANTLTFLPGVSAMSTGVGIAKPVIRGFSGARVAVLDMGIRQEGQQWGNDHGLEWDQFSIGKLTVVKGAAGLEFGGDAMGGALVIEHEPWPSTKSNSQILSVVSNNNRQRGWSVFHQQVMKLNHAVNARFGVRITQLRTDDYRVPTDSFTYLKRTLPLKDGWLTNTATDERHITAFSEWRFPKNTLRSIKIIYRLNKTQSGLFPGFVGIPTVQSVAGDGDASNFSLPSVTNRHQKLLLAMQFKAGDDFIRFNVGFQRSERQELSRPHQPGFVPMNADSLSLGLTLNTTQWNVWKDWVLPNAWRLKTGLQFQLKQNEIQGNEFLIPQFTQHQQAFYASVVDQNEFRFHQFFGFRIEQGGIVAQGYQQPWYNMNQPTDSLLVRSLPLSNSRTGWAAQYGWTWNAPSDWQIHCVLGKVYRVPQINEWAINGIHHGSHRHEKGNAQLNWESGYQWDANVMKEWKNGHAQWTGFVAYYDNFIFLSPQSYFSDLPDGGQVYQYLQKQVMWSGGEIFADWHPLMWWNTDFSAEAIYTREMETGLGFPFVAPITLKSNQRFHWEMGSRHAFSILLNTRYAFDQNRVARNEKQTKGYFVMNVNAQYTYQWTDQNSLSVVLQCNNVNDHVYYNHLSLYRPMNLPEQGRWVQGTVVFNF